MITNKEKINIINNIYSTFSDILSKELDNKAVTKLLSSSCITTTISKLVDSINDDVNNIQTNLKKTNKNKIYG